MTVKAPVEPAERSEAARADSYRPHLDGMRAVAVALVIAFHAGVGRLSGGFIGVDVFFVLSGYLVTQVLLRDLDGSGSVRFGRFYSRRMRRLLPAALVVLVGTAIIYTAIASPIEALDARGAVRAAALWFSNWFFIAEASDYFATEVAGSPVLHFWSLSIEEQFYLLWPLALTGLFRLCRRAGARQRSQLRRIVAVLALASLGAAWWIGRTNVTRAYYGTDTRAYQLLAGALLALTPTIMTRFASSAPGKDQARRWPAWTSAAGLVALGLLASSWWDISAVTRGMAATVATVGLLVALEASVGGPRRVLSLAPMVYLGRISYGIYLWHWIIILVLNATFELSSVETAVGAAVLASALASLSYQMLEMPVRKSARLDRRARLVLATGLTASLLVGLIIAPRILERDTTTRRSTDSALSAGSTPVPAGLDWQSASKDQARHPSCQPGATDECVLVSGGEPHVLVVGDSTASMYVPALEVVAEEESFTLSAAVSPGCSWVRGIQRFDATGQVGPLGKTGAEVCQQTQTSWYESVIPEIDPDVVVVVHRPYDDPANPIPLQDEELGELAPGSAELAAAYQRRVQAAVTDLHANGAIVVILEPGPAATADADPLVCISGATYLEECEFEATAGPTPVEAADRAVAGEADWVWSIDVDPLVCPSLPTCDAVVDGVIARWDSVHLTTEFSRTLADALGEQLRATGAIG